MSSTRNDRSGTDHVAVDFDTQRGRSRLPGPHKVQIQTVDRCNAVCPACPYSPANVTGEPNCMTEELYIRILEGLRRAGNLTKFTLSLQNEPLMDPQLAARVRQARAVLGEKVRIHIVTNGALLDKNRGLELVAAGADLISVSIDAVSEETYRQVRPSLNFDRVVSNTRALLRAAPAGTVEARILCQRANAAEIEPFVHYWQSQGAQTNVFGMTNRAGSVAGYSKLRAPIKDESRRSLGKSLWQNVSCLFGPGITLNVLWDGRVLICCHDWVHESTLGDLNKESLEEIWQSDKVNRIRRLLWERRFSEIPICSRCSVTDLERQG